MTLHEVIDIVAAAVAAAADYEKQGAVAVTADYAGSYVPQTVEVASSDLAPSD